MLKLAIDVPREAKYYQDINGGSGNDELAVLGADYLCVVVLACFLYFTLVSTFPAMEKWIDLMGRWTTLEGHF